MDSILDGDTSAKHDYNPCKEPFLDPWAWVVYTLLEYLHQGRRSLEEAHADLKSGFGESLCAGSPGIWVTRARSRRDISLARWISSQAMMWEDGQGRAFYNGGLGKGHCVLRSMFPPFTEVATGSK